MNKIKLIATIMLLIAFSIFVNIGDGNLIFTSACYTIGMVLLIFGDASNKRNHNAS